jgi:hypothetical protein
MISGTQAAETHIFQRFLGGRAWYGYALVLLSQKVSAVFEANHVFGEIHFSACEGLG